MLKITSGFGKRLREERDRIGLNQAQLGEIAGVTRLTQGQYEKESCSPTVRYLAAIGESGIDLHYLLFGTKARPFQDDQRGLEKRIFEMVEEHAQRQPDGHLGAEGRYAMFDFLRAALTKESNALPLSPFISNDK